MKKKWLFEILSFLGMTSVGTGLGLGMDASNADPWQIAVTVVGWVLAWVIGHASGTYYFKVKAFVHEVSDMLEDDKITLPEIKDVINAWKTGKYQPDTVGKKKK